MSLAVRAATFRVLDQSWEAIICRVVYHLLGDDTEVLGNLSDWPALAVLVVMSVS